MQTAADHRAIYTNNVASGGTNHYGHNIYNYSNGPSDSDPHQCLRDLRVTDPREDLARIRSEKDELLRDCYAWILDDPSFQQWKTQNTSRLLWISGDPGKGKTMMTMGVIAEFSHTRSSQEGAASEVSMLDDNSTSLLSFFFCQKTLPALNNAASVLRGLIYMLVVQRRCLLRYVKAKYEVAGKQLFDGYNAIYSLQSILSDILEDACLPPTYFLVDALDECTSGLPALLQVITDASLARRSRVKWLLTSRNLPEIGRYLQLDALRIKVSLEVKASHVSRAVAAFVDYKVQRLMSVNDYDEKLQAEIQEQLRIKAEGTFLWVSLVCKELDGVPLWRTREVLQALPPGLDPLYERMMAQINAQDARTVRYCGDVLETMTLAFRPLQLEELAVAAGLPGDYFFNAQTILDLVGRCGSFLTVRESAVSFVHLSAKDYLTMCNGRQVFNGTTAHKHRQMTERLLDAMGNALQRDMCGLQKPGARIHEALVVERIKSSRLRQMAYACEYWTEHLQAGMHVADSGWLYIFLLAYLSPLLVAMGLLEKDFTCKDILAENGRVHGFFQKHLLHWLEAMSLLQKVPEAIAALQKIEVVVKASESTVLPNIVHDALRFAAWSGSGLQEAPLQVYYSALVFAPERSIVRQQYRQEAPVGVRVKPGLDREWGALLQTLEGHTSFVTSVAFSASGDQLASASQDKTVRVWDAKTGQPLHTLEGHTSFVTSVAFSANGDRLASASHDKTVRLWDTKTGQPLHTLEGHSSSVTSMAFSAEGERLASASGKAIWMWDAKTGQPLHTLKGHTGGVTSVAFSADGNQLASASYDKTVRLWDAKTGQLLYTLEGHESNVRSVAFSADSDRLASASYDKTVRLWHLKTGQLLSTLKGHTGSVHSVAFLADGERLASASGDNTVRVWDAKTGKPLHRLEGHTSIVSSVAFSADSDRLASSSRDETVRVWDVKTGQALHTLKAHTHWVNSVVFSADGERLASASHDKTVRVWDGKAGQFLHTLDSHTDSVSSVVFSADGNRLASASHDTTVRVWDAKTGQLLHTLKGHTDPVRSVIFSSEGDQIASISQDRIVQVWDAKIGQLLHTLKGHTNIVSSVAFSVNGELLASASHDKTVRVWNAGQLLHTLQGHTDSVNNVAFSVDGSRLASASHDKTVQVWDTKTGQPLHRLEGHTSIVSSVTFSADSDRLASGSRDKTVRVWDVKTGQALHTLEGHINTVNSVAFSVDGIRLASASYDRTVRVWDVRLGQLLHTFEHARWVSSVAFSQDGSSLLTNIGTLSLPQHTLPQQTLSACALSHWAPAKTILIAEKWLTVNAEDVLWIPADYRPSWTAVHSSCIAFGCSSGRILLLVIQ